MNTKERIIYILNKFKEITEDTQLFCEVDALITATENSIFEIPDILKNELKLAERDKHKSQYDKGYSSGLNVAINFLNDKK